MQTASVYGEKENLRLVSCTPGDWEFVRELRNTCSESFLQTSYITEEEHKTFMDKYGRNYYICWYKNERMGFIGFVNDDIRLAVCPKGQNRGIGTYMIQKLSNWYPSLVGRIKASNKASIKAFKAAGFTEDLITMKRKDAI